MTTLADLVFAAAIRAEIAASLAILLVLAVRGTARRLVGAELAYRLWAVAPVAAVVAIFPSLQDFAHRPTLPAADLALTAADGALVLRVWLTGAALTAVAMTLSELRFRRLAARGRAGPAVMGVLWPRMVTPADYSDRFTPGERDLIRLHEHTHIQRGHPAANLFMAAMRALNWFNPLVHLAAAAARLDQELACDACVIEARPECRRLYGATLLKAHLASPTSPLACAWRAPSRHPLETRLEMLARRPLSLALYLRGAGLIGFIALITLVGIWGTGPSWTGEPPAFSWPPAQSVLAGGGR